MFLLKIRFINARLLFISPIVINVKSIGITGVGICCRNIGKLINNKILIAVNILKYIGFENDFQIQNAAIRCVGKAQMTFKLFLTGICSVPNHMTKNIRPDKPAISMKMPFQIFVIFDFLIVIFKIKLNPNRNQKSKFGVTEKSVSALISSAM
ncbi:MAG: hypothetical protein ACJAUH_001963 [Saprospiraceae bacterium]